MLIIIKVGEKGMVKPELDYNLNHIEFFSVFSPEIIIGDDVESANDELNLFEKSLALTSDLKRLPILRSIKGIYAITANFGGPMNASGVSAIRASATIYNGLPTEENIIDVMEFHADENTGKLQVVTENHEAWDFEGGILLKNKLSFRITLFCSSNVASTALPANLLEAKWLMEIDWVPVSKKKFEEFILESVYAESD